VRQGADEDEHKGNRYPGFQWAVHGDSQQRQRYGKKNRMRETAMTEGMTVGNIEVERHDIEIRCDRTNDASPQQTPRECLASRR
jgi:hypothetical protein